MKKKTLILNDNTDKIIFQPKPPKDIQRIDKKSKSLTKVYHA